MPTTVHHAEFEKLAADTLARWAAVPVTIASDIAGIPIAIDPRIRPLRVFPLGKRMVGQAVTAWCERSDFGAMLHALDIARAGEIVMVDAQGCLQTAYCGEILCGYARRKKIAGLVVNGAVRDIDTIASWDDFPLFALGIPGSVIAAIASRCSGTLTTHCSSSTIRSAMNPWAPAIPRSV